MKSRRILTIAILVIAAIGGTYLTLPHLYPSFPINYAYLEILGIHDTYKTGQTIEFQIHAIGYGMTCDRPSVVIYKSDQPSVVVYEQKLPPFMCPIESPVFFDTVYPNKNDTYSLTIKDPSKYTIDTSFLNNEIKKEFTIK